MPFCTASSLRIHYHLHGRQGPPLILITGLSSDLKWWERLIPELEKDFQVITFDNRGAGLTDKPGGKYSIPMFADDTVKLLDTLGIPEAHIFGVSMGGMVAQELALRAPHRIGRLALGCTHCGGKGFFLPPMKVLKEMTTSKRKSSKDNATQTIRMQFSPEFRKNNPDLVQAMIRHHLDHQPPDEASNQQFWAVWGHDCYDRLQDIRAETLILAGEADVLIPRENVDVLLSRIPRSRLVTLPGCGHAFFIEKPETTAQHLKAHFLNEFHQ